MFIVYSLRLASECLPAHWTSIHLEGQVPGTHLFRYNAGLYADLWFIVEEPHLLQMQSQFSQIHKN